MSAQMDLISVGFSAVLALGIGLYAVSVPQGGRAWWGLATVIVALVITGELAGDSLARTIALDLAELAGVALVWSHATKEATAAARAYLYSILPAIACTLIAFASMAAVGGNRPAPAVESLVVCLVIVGFALKLGLIPFYFWLPAVAAAAAPMTTALIVSVVDIATFAELAAIRQLSPWVFTEHTAVWMAVAVISMFGGALLALAQTELKRMLAFSTIADLGFLLLGLIAGGSGLPGAWIGALSHALSKVILFGAVGLAEARIGRTVTLDTSGLGARLPLASAAFIVGALSFIGIPPGFGFGGYWRIYVAASQFGGPALIAILLAAAALDLLCYARAIHRTWLGPAQIALTGPRISFLAPGVLTLLAVAAILLGCYPSVLTRAIVASPLAMAR